MRYRRAVEKLRLLAAASQSTTRLPVDEPFLHEAYVFGDVLDGADPVESVQVALALNLSPEEVPWCSQPPGTAWLVDSLRLDKGGFAYWWRSRHEPVWNHVIRDPVRFWSLDGTDESVLDALRDRRFADLPRATVSPADLRQRVEVELDRATPHRRPEILGPRLAWRASRGRPLSREPPLGSRGWLSRSPGAVDAVSGRDRAQGGG